MGPERNVLLLSRSAGSREIIVSGESEVCSSQIGEELQRGGSVVCLPLYSNGSPSSCWQHGPGPAFAILMRATDQEISSLGNPPIRLLRVLARARASAASPRAALRWARRGGSRTLAPGDSPIAPAAPEAARPLSMKRLAGWEAQQWSRARTRTEIKTKC